MDEIGQMEMSTILIGEDGYSVTITKRLLFKDVLFDIQHLCDTHGNISTSELAGLIKSKKSKVKRHAREVLGPDSKTGQGQGYARQLTIQQAIRIYIYGMLIRHLSQRDIKLTTARVIKRLKTSDVYSYCLGERY